MVKYGYIKVLGISGFYSFEMLFIVFDKFILVIIILRLGE